MHAIAYLVLFFLLILSFFFSLTETAFTALNRIRIKNLADKGHKRARLTLALYDDFDRLLSTLLVGTNISNITSAAICTVLFVNAFGDFGATLSAMATTVVVLIFAEVTPKNLAKERPEAIALFCAPIAKFFMVLFTPFNGFFALWKKLLLKVFKTNVGAVAITEGELISIVEEASHSGVIDEDDKALIKNVIEFYDQQTKEVLTPRMDVVAVAKGAPVDDIATLFFESGFSRLPVYDGSIDNIIGILHTRDFLRFALQKNMPLESILSPVVYVPPQMDIGDLFSLLQKEKMHMAIVVDEYGGTEGIVTMEDILEELLGEIYDESDKVVEPFLRIGENRHKVRCTVDTHELFEYFRLTEQPEITHRYPTLNSWVVQMLGKVPEKGDFFVYENLTITVHKTEGRRAVECVVSVGITLSTTAYI